MKRNILKEINNFKNKKFFDLVCGMELGIREVKYISKYKGGIYHFCSKSCQKHFTSQPGMYVYL